MGKTTEIAADRAFDQTKTVLPAEVAQGVYMENAPSLRALKLMHLMIGKAAGRMADDVLHDMRLSDIRNIEGMAHHDQQSLKPLFAELRAATIIHDKPEQSSWTIGGLLDEATVDYRHELTGDVLISWSFGRTFRRMALESNHWAILDRQAVFHLGSKYSVLLFQHIASLQNLKHVTSKRFTVPELRAVLGIPKGKVKRFANLKKDALEPAIEDINSDLTRLNLTATYHKVGRTVVEVKIAWDVKQDLTKVRAELDRPKTGRKARREGTAEPVVEAFPESGSIKFNKFWCKLAEEHVARSGGHLPDLGKLAQAFRDWTKAKSIPLDKSGIEKTFVGFCRSYSSR
jgi:hypothetical protein